MRIDLNGASIETRARTLQDLIEEHGFADAAVATAVNGSFIPRTARDTAASAGCASAVERSRARLR